MKRLLVLLAIIAIATNLSFAQGVKRKIVFKRGLNSATIEGNVIRGDLDEYTINARKNQKMRVSISSIENNTVFQIYLEARTLKGAGESKDATDWQGDLPRNGVYKIIVGGTRGNASYTLKVVIE